MAARRIKFTTFQSLGKTKTKQRRGSGVLGEREGEIDVLRISNELMNVAGD